MSSCTACCKYVHNVTIAPSNSFDTHSGVSIRVLQPDIRGSVGVESKLEQSQMCVIAIFQRVMLMDAVTMWWLLVVLFSVFSSGCQFESARCSVDDFGSCFVRVFSAMPAQALRPERPRQHLVQSHVQ